MSCGICISDFNRSTRRKVTCGFCAYEACRECQKTFILGSVNDPHCMNCKVPWNSEFIIANFTKKFFNEDLAKHRAEALYEREKALMPHTQERVRVWHLRDEIACLTKTAEMYKRILRPEEAARYEALVAERRRELPEEAAGPSSGRAVTAASAPRPVCGCVRAGCTGFVMNNNWKCGMCDVKVCDKCLKEDVPDAHECAAEDVETRKLLLSNTKPCPKCGVMISKVDGCNQMWCVMCHTTFDWKSGEVVKTQMVHNPHYFEWMRRNNREIPRTDAVVVPCGEQDAGAPLPFQVVMTALRDPMYHNSRSPVALQNIYRLTVHIHDVVRRDTILEDVGIFEQLRIDFLTRRMPLDAYKGELVRVERRKERKAAMWQVASLFMTQGADVIRHVVNNRPQDLRPHVEELRKLADYCNEEWTKIGRAYKCSWYTISTGFGNLRMSNRAPPPV